MESSPYLRFDNKGTKTIGMSVIAILLKKVHVLKLVVNSS